MAIGSVVSVPGPDLNAEKICPGYDTDADESRRVGRGLNIEFVTETGSMLIGHVGYVTKWDLARKYHRAKCLSTGKRCPSMESIRDFWFVNCKVRLRGRLSNGKRVDKVEHFGTATYFNGHMESYAWLEFTVTYWKHLPYGDSDAEDSDSVFSPYAQD